MSEFDGVWSSRIILDLNYINTQKNSIQRNLMNYLVNDLH